MGEQIFVETDYGVESFRVFKKRDGLQILRSCDHRADCFSFLEGLSYRLFGIVPGRITAWDEPEVPLSSDTPPSTRAEASTE